MAYDYRVTSDFLDMYESLDDGAIAAIDEAVGRLLVDDKSAWARQGRVSGESGGAWIIELRTPAAEIALYWDYLDGHLILLIAVIPRAG